ncbi:MAG: helix-turn-helix domain-containing protein [Accumulibacter sp.]|jgi:DNA-binding HxlR family transcriptional regulator|uniref:winged helix-turn-helix transcriptional regulator n=1 Tax=Accumulibacter sp. TaxID=2053492 RepID=UPI002FC371E0
MKLPPHGSFRSLCPLAASLDLLGDRWSLLIVRDLMARKTRYKDFQGSPERIPTNILAQRLKLLEENGLIARRPYQQRPLRYEYFLTAKGADLLPVLQQLALWGQKYVPDSWTPPAWFATATAADLLARDAATPPTGEPGDE